MKEVFRQIPLYRFLSYCNESKLEKKILDCGAGGNMPPLSLFADYGYSTHGIELSLDQLNLANQYAATKGQNLGIEQGHMKYLMFKDEYFSFVYSYNSIFHMKKSDIAASIKEMKRVLAPGGYLFVNFLTTADAGCNEGTALSENNEYEQIERNMPVVHSYYTEEEADEYFKDMDVVYKEYRVLERIINGEKVKQSYIDYIAKKL